MIFMIIYFILGYWATGETICKNKVYIEFEFGALFMHRVMWGAILGWILIPVAVIKKMIQGGVSITKILGGIIAVIAVIIVLCLLFGKDTPNENGETATIEGTYKSEDGAYVVIELTKDWGDGLYSGNFAETASPWVKTEVVIDTDSKKITYKLIEAEISYQIDNTERLTLTSPSLSRSYSKISNECEYDKIMDKSKMTIEDVIGAFKNAASYHIIIDKESTTKHVNIKVYNNLGMLEGERKGVNYIDLFNNNKVQVSIEDKEYNVYFAGERVLVCEAYFDGFVKQNVIFEGTDQNESHEETTTERIQEKETESIIQEEETTTIYVENDNNTLEIDREDVDATGIPQIKLRYNELTLSVGEEFYYMDALAEWYDDKDDVSRRVYIEGEYDIYVPGTYVLKYYVMDTDRNVSNIETLTLIIKDDTTIEVESSTSKDESTTNRQEETKGEEVTTQTLKKMENVYVISDVLHAMIAKCDGTVVWLEMRDGEYYLHTSLGDDIKIELVDSGYPCELIYNHHTDTMYLLQMVCRNWTHLTDIYVVNEDYSLSMLVTVENAIINGSSYWESLNACFFSDGIMYCDISLKNLVDCTTRTYIGNVNYLVMSIISDDMYAYGVNEQGNEAIIKVDFDNNVLEEYFFPIEIYYNRNGYFWWCYDKNGYVYFIGTKSGKEYIYQFDGTSYSEKVCLNDYRYYTGIDGYEYMSYTDDGIWIYDAENKVIKKFWFQ